MDLEDIAGRLAPTEAILPFLAVSRSTFLALETEGRLTGRTNSDCLLDKSQVDVVCQGVDLSSSRKMCGFYGFCCF